MNNIAASSNNLTAECASNHEYTSIQYALVYTSIWMMIGTFAGAALGFYEGQRAVGNCLPIATLFSALTGSVVGASLGQLIGGLYHIIIDRSLDSE